MQYSLRLIPLFLLLLRDKSLCLYRMVNTFIRGDVLGIRYVPVHHCGIEEDHR